MKTKKALILILFFPLSWVIFAKNAMYFMSIVEDSAGYIYFITDTGIKRFDGYQYVDLSDISNLPSTWSDSAVYRESNDSLYAAFFKEGIWKLDLSSNQAKKISDLKASKIVLSSKYLMAKVEKEVYLINLSNLNTRKYDLQEVIDIAAIEDQHFAITHKGLFKVNSEHSELIESFQTTKAHLALFNHKLAYSTDYKLTLLSLKNNTPLAVRTFENEITAITSYNTNSFAIAHGSNIDILSSDNLDIVKTSINRLNQVSRILYEDKQSNLWSTDTTQFEVIDPHLTLLRLPIPSRYNVVELVEEKLWIGTDHGLYYSDKGLFKPITEINDQLPLLERSITDILYTKNKPIIIATTAGAYKLENNILAKIYDGYVLSLSYINSEFILATSNKLVGFDENFNPVNFDLLNDKLPHKEVLNVKKINNTLYIMTADGLVQKTQNIITTHDISPHNLTDVFASLGNIYVTTWGDGLFKKEGNKWVSMGGPKKISSTIAYYDETLLSTSNGLYQFKDEQISLVPNSAGQMFIANSLAVKDNLAYASSNKELITVDYFKAPSLNPPKFTQFPTSDTPYDQTFTIAANSFDYIHGELIRYEYKLNNGDWVDVKNGKVKLSYLDTGYHNIQMRASYNATQWKYSEMRSFNITGPWYRSKTFIFLTALIFSVVAILRLLYIFRLNKQKNKVFKIISKQQEKQGLVKTYAELTKAKNALSKNNPIITKHTLNIIENAISQFEELLDNYSAIKALGNTSLEDSFTGLDALACMQIKSHEFQISLCERCTIETRNIIFFIAHTLVHNSLQHAKADFMQLTVTCDAENVKIFVQDDGIGIKYSDYTFNFGVGIAIIKNIVYERKGKLKFKNWRKSKSWRSDKNCRRRKGTFVSVVIPLLPSEVSRHARQLKEAES
ncbi:hypothetical protein [Aliikangiella maris]|uniref:Histidine kinase/HSP90-like ATPase domain-containing protein n=2 Tax=Aliikangiella maris TaxID=3162458 RepID=A0ABV3MJM3_9GAMM